MRSPKVFFAAGMLQTGLTALLAMLTIPLFVSTYGSEMFGFYALLSAILAYVAMAGFGVDVATGITMNKEPSSSARLAIFRAGERICMSLSLVLLSVLLALWLLDPLWLAQVFMLPSNAPPLLAASNLMLGAGVLAVWFNVYAAGLRGERAPHLENFIQIGISASIYLLTLSAKLLGLSFLQYSIGFLAINICFYIGRAFAYRRIAHLKGILPQGDDVEQVVSRRALVRMGLACSLSSVATLLIANFDIFLISRTFGLESSAHFAAFMRLIALGSAVIYALNAAFIPALGKAIGSGKIENALEIHAVMKTLSQVAALGMAALLASYGNPFMQAWTGFDLDFAIYVAGGMYLIVFAQMNCNMIFYNTTARVSKVAQVLVAEAALKVAISIILVPQFGLAAAPLSTIVSMSICSLGLLAYLNRDLVIIRSGGMGSLAIAMAASVAFGAVSLLVHGWLTYATAGLRDLSLLLAGCALAVAVASVTVGREARRSRSSLASIVRRTAQLV